MKNLFLVWLAAAVFSVSAVSGCSTVQKKPQTPGIPVYSLGSLLVMVNKPVPDIAKAAEAGYKDLGINITNSKSDSLTGVVEGKLSDGRNVVANLKSVNSQETDVSIKVGTLGEKNYSYTIWSSIEKHL